MTGAGRTHSHRWLDVLPDDASEVTQVECMHCQERRSKPGRVSSPFTPYEEAAIRSWYRVDPEPWSPT